MKKIILALVLSIMFSATASAEMMLFVGDTCPHCGRLEEYLEKNNLYQKLEIVSYEIYNNKENLELYLRTSDALGYENGAVPLLVDGEKFIDGADPIIDYLTAQTPGSIESTRLSKEDSEMLNAIIAQKIAEEPVPIQADLPSEKPKIMIGMIILIALVGGFYSLLRLRRFL